MDGNGNLVEEICFPSNWKQLAWYTPEERKTKHQIIFYQTKNKASNRLLFVAMNYDRVTRQYKYVFSATQCEWP